VRRNFLIRSGLASLWVLLACSGPAACVAAAGVDGGKDAARPVILVLGDSLSAEYGLPRGTGWVQLLAERLRNSGLDYRVVNVSISGETTSGGRTRLPALLEEHRPKVVVIELGANDALRGLPLALVKANLAELVRASQAAGAKTLLVGMRIPPNYGRDYAERYFSTYAEVARERRAALVPLLVDGFADSLDYFQADRIHPTVQAQTMMLDTVWKGLRPLLSVSPKR
jgi:acyl-CoA thioesterase-1